MSGSSNQGQSAAVTLIIPTVSHRAALFSRTLRYLSDCGYDGPIVVSDHSAPDGAQAIPQVIGERPGLDVRLLVHDPALHFLERLTQCAAVATTPYVHLHADDDFIVVPMLERLVAQMDRAPGCAAAMGINMNIWLAERRFSVIPKEPILQDDPFDRLVAQLENYSSVLYALRRREEFMTSLSFAVSRCPDVQFWQYLESCVAALRGTIAFVEDLHYVRSVHDRKWSTTLVREQSPDHFPHLLLSPEFSARLTAFRGALLSACDERGVRADTKVLDSALVHLLARGLTIMGLPERRTPKSDASREDLLLKKLTAGSAATAAMQRIGMYQ